MVEQIIAEVKEKQAEIDKLKKELHKKSEQAFFEGAKKIFESCPDLKSVSWTQYTPYFNDGDTCEFSVHTDYLEINGDYDDRSGILSPTIVVNRGTWSNTSRTYENRVEKPNPDYNQPLAEAVDKVHQFLNVFNEDFYKDQFGDHVKITLTPEGVDTEEYEHE